MIPLMMGSCSARGKYTPETTFTVVSTGSATLRIYLRGYHSPDRGDSVIDWGDGTPQTTWNGSYQGFEHTYAPGTFYGSLRDNTTENNPSISGSALRSVTGYQSGLKGFHTFWSGPSVNLISLPPELPRSMTDLGDMLAGASAFSQDISGWDVSNVVDMGALFYYNDSFNQDISGWDVSNVVDMGYMFHGASAFNQDLSGWCVRNISSEPTSFATDTHAWVLPKPVWGTCPGG